MNIMNMPIYRVVCPCCACALFNLNTAFNVVWVCANCSFSMMGLAIPVRFIDNMSYMPEKLLHKTLWDVEELTE